MQVRSSEPPAGRKQEPLRQKVLFNLLDQPVTPAVALMLLVSFVTTMGWVLTGDWALNNILGMALCITYVSIIRLPNIKVTQHLSAQTVAALHTALPLPFLKAPCGRANPTPP
eukprot:6304506-Pyramimonas_sp.AAC.2